MDIIPSDLNTYGGEAKRLLEDLQSRNERMFLITVLFLNTAKTKQELDNAIFQTAGIAQKYNCVLRRLDKPCADQTGINNHVHCYFCAIYYTGAVYGRRVFILRVKCSL